MAERSRQERPWALTEGALDGLLACMDADRTAASERYEQVRRKLIKFFEWRGCPFPEELADEAINRVARKIAGGLDLEGDAVYRYFHGVARVLARETFRDLSREQSALRLQLVAATGAEDGPAWETRLECLRSCLTGLSPEDSELLLQYYRGEKGEKIRNRKELAARLGVPMNALRIRVHRLRERLERCLADCPRGSHGHEIP